jgi:hypothetical protein
VVVPGTDVWTDDGSELISSTEEELRGADEGYLQVKRSSLRNRTEPENSKR